MPCVPLRAGRCSLTEGPVFHGSVNLGVRKGAMGSPKREDEYMLGRGKRTDYP